MPIDEAPLTAIAGIDVWKAARLNEEGVDNVQNLAMEDPSFGEDPWPHFEAARKKHPFLAKCSFAHILTAYDAIRDLMVHEDKMRIGHTGVVEIMGGTGTRWGRFIEESVQVQWGHTHKRLRAVLAPAFTPRQANIHRPLMRETISRVLDEWAKMRAAAPGAPARPDGATAPSREGSFDPRENPDLGDLERAAPEGILDLFRLLKEAEKARQATQK